ncbi:MAG TPA: hypothetical protein VFZ52_13730 [Chryseolinea sp.]
MIWLKKAFQAKTFLTERRIPEGKDREVKLLGAIFCNYYKGTTKEFVDYRYIMNFENVTSLGNFCWTTKTKSMTSTTYAMAGGRSRIDTFIILILNT